ncbi:MAG: tRNA (guanosine(18)-2'-O)-methyltransferase TrmH [Longimicrobiales bacterium]
MTPERYQRIREVLAQRTTDLTVLMEQVNKPHNFSAIVRTCDAVGVGVAHAVIPAGSKLGVQHYAAGGSAAWVDVKSHDTVESAATQLKASGFRIIAAHRSQSSVPLTDVDLTRPVAVMVGAELDGISGSGLSLADEVVEIPMSGMVGSLNVSVATAVILYEALRQRKAHSSYQPTRLSKAEQDRLAIEWSYPKITAICRKKGLPYPDLDDQGYLIGSTG